MDKEEKEEVLIITADYMKGRLENDSSGHDWWHTYRVWNLGRRISEGESADAYIVGLSCLLHDIADYKLHGGDEEIGPRLAGEWLKSLNIDNKTISDVQEIIYTIPFKGKNSPTNLRTIEAKCVQDADRLDAIGAIGIARCFAFGGKKGNTIYNPHIKPDIEISEEEYKKSKSTPLNHFHEKLFLLKDLMNTQTAKLIAESRHRFMEQFVDRFLKEWNGEL